MLHSNPTIVAELENFVCLKLEKGKHKEAFEELKMKSIPAIIMHDKDGKEIFRNTGMLSEEKIIAALKAAL